MVGVPRIDLSSNGATPFQRVLGHVPRVGEAWVRVEREFYEAGRLDAELKEQVRRTLAQSTGCEYCKARGAPSFDASQKRTSLAAAFAQAVAGGHQSITDSQFLVLREDFDDAEIAELVAFVCFTIASQMIGAVVQLR